MIEVPTERAGGVSENGETRLSASASPHLTGRQSALFSCLHIDRSFFVQIRFLGLYYSLSFNPEMEDATCTWMLITMTRSNGTNVRAVAWRAGHLCCLMIVQPGLPALLCAREQAFKPATISQSMQVGECISLPSRKGRIRTLAQQKRTKAKSKTASDAATDLIPADIRELLGPSPVVDIAEEPIFERLLAGAVSELRPSGMIEWTLVYDFVVTTWDIRQLREFKTSFLQVENVKYSNYQKRKGMTDEQAKWVMDKVNYIRDAADPELTKEQNFKSFEQRFKETISLERPEIMRGNYEELNKLSVGETNYNGACRLSKVISNQAGTIDHLQKMTLMLEKRRDGLLRDLDRRQAARREQNAVHPRHDRDAADIETQAQA